MKKIAILSATLALVLAAPAFANNHHGDHKSETKIEKDADGSVEATTKSKTTDAGGTTTTSEKKVDLDVKDNGDYTKTTTTETKTDPKGLMNSTTTETKDVVEKKDGVVTTEHKKEVNGDTVEESKSAD